MALVCYVVGQLGQVAEPNPSGRWDILDLADQSTV